MVIADLADDKGKELASELGVRYARTDATNTDDPRSTAPSSRASSKTITSTAKSFGWTARCASRRSRAAPNVKLALS